LGLQYSNNSSIVHEQHSCFREGAIAKLKKEYVLKIISGPVSPQSVMQFNQKTSINARGIKKQIFEQDHG